MANDLGGVWRTVGGRRIFIKDSEDLATAMKNSGKFKDKEGQETKTQPYKNIVYHGTKTDFEEFDEEKIGSNKRVGDAPLNVGKGFYFTEEEDVAKSYGKDGYVKKVELTIEKPLDFENYKGVTSKELDSYMQKYEKDNIKAYQEFLGYTEKQAYDEIRSNWEQKFKKPYGIVMYAESISQGDYKTYVKTMGELGYDGILNRKKHEVVAFKKEQIKVIK